MESILFLMHDESLSQNIKHGIPFDDSILNFDKIINNNYEQKYNIGTSYDFQLSSELNDNSYKLDIGNIIYPIDFDYAYDILSECLDYNKRSFELAQKALNIIKQFHLSNFNYVCCIFVFYPELLNEFLEVTKLLEMIISENDLNTMFCICLECEPKNKNSKIDLPFINEPCRIDRVSAYKSIEYLIEYIVKYKEGIKIEIKLLPVKYNIDSELYNILKLNGISDSYYDATINLQYYKYNYPDIVSQKKKDSYTGFRDSYHILIYGNEIHLQSLIVYWDIWGDDDTADAVRDYFNLDSDSPIELLVNYINKKCDQFK